MNCLTINPTLMRIQPSQANAVGREQIMIMLCSSIRSNSSNCSGCWNISLSHTHTLFEIYVILLHYAILQLSQYEEYSRHDNTSRAPNIQILLISFRPDRKRLT